MRPRPIVVLALGALVCALAVAVGYSLRHPAPPTDTPPARLTALAADDIDHVRVRHGSDLVRLARQDDAWRLTSPATAAADPAHMEMLMALCRVQPARRLSEDTPLDAATTGLGPSAIVVSFNDRPPIRIGGPGPIPGTRYVQTPAATFLVTIPHFKSLSWHWTDWLDRSLVPPGQQLTRLVLPHYTLTDNAAGGDGWQVAPAGARSPAAAAETIAAWQRARALMIVPADQRRARIARITQDFVDAPTRYLDVIETSPHLILRDPRLGVDYHLAGNRVAPLLALKHPGL